VSNAATGTTRTAAAGRHPWVYAVLYFPMGLMLGYPSVALGYLGSRAGLPISSIAAIVGMSFLAHGFKFIWAPIGDYSLSRKRWWLIAAGGMALGMVAITVTPISTRTVPLLSALVFCANFVSTFLAFATEGLLAHNTTPATRGRAAGWFQSGNQFGQTGGGGIGLLLMKHLRQPWMAGVALGALILACSLCLLLVEEPPRALQTESVRARAMDAWNELAGVIRSRAGRVGLLLAILPIGTGAAQFLFGSLGPEWHAPADVVSFVLGAGGGVAIVAGCMSGGFIADYMSKTKAYALACAIGVVAVAVMPFSPRTEFWYAATTLFYTFALGLSVATFTGMILSIIGDRAAATKINVFIALNTMFSLFVLRILGGVHERLHTNGMLLTEAALGVLALVVYAAVAARIPGADRAD
jgi:MFS family permease